MKNLKLYFTSDIHGYVYPTDYTNNEFKNMGLLNIINSFNKDGNTLIIDCGDTIQGSPFTTYLSNSKFDIHPIAKVMNEGLYDFITLGNHDFNYGYDYLDKYLNNLNAKCLCANVYDNTSKLPIYPYDIKTLENGLKIGLVGFTTDFIPVWEKEKNLENFTITNTFNEAKRYHDELKDKVDILIGFYHGGFENDLADGKVLSTTYENIAYKISKELSFDILLTGHQHMNINGQYLFDTFIVQTPNNGTKFIELNLKYSNKIEEINSKLKEPISKPNVKMYNELMLIENNVQEWLDTPVGFLDCDLLPKTHLEMALNGSPLANFINQIQLDKSLADISCASFANTVKGFNKEVTVRDIVSTYIYPNTLKVLKIDGKTLKKALLRTSDYFEIEDNIVKISDSFLKPKIEHYNYDYFSGIEYTFNLSKSGIDRIVSVKFKGKEINDSDIFSLAMNNYRSSGTGGYEFYKSCEVIKDIQVEITEIIIDYFNNHKNVVVDKTKYINIKK